MSKEETRHEPPKNRGPMAVGEKAKDFKGSFKRLFKELGSFKIIMLIAILLAIVSSVLSIYAPNLLTDLTDEIVIGLIPNKKIDFDTLNRICIILGILYVSSALSGYIESLICNEIKKANIR